MNIQLLQHKKTPVGAAMVSAALLSLVATPAAYALSFHTVYSPSEVCFATFTTGTYPWSFSLELGWGNPNTSSSSDIFCALPNYFSQLHPGNLDRVVASVRESNAASTAVVGRLCFDDRVTDDYACGSSASSIGSPSAFENLIFEEPSGTWGSSDMAYVELTLPRSGGTQARVKSLSAFVD